jgi:hypothetical protein
MIENVYLFFNSSCEICTRTDSDVNFAVCFTPGESMAEFYEVKNDGIDGTVDDLIGYVAFADKISGNEQVRQGLMEWLWTGEVDDTATPVLLD